MEALRLLPPNYHSFRRLQCATRKSANIKQIQSNRTYHIGKNHQVTFDTCRNCVQVPLRIFIIERVRAEIAHFNEFEFWNLIILPGIFPSLHGSPQTVIFFIFFIYKTKKSSPKWQHDYSKRLFGCSPDIN